MTGTDYASLDPRVAKLVKTSLQGVTSSVSPPVVAVLASRDTM